MKNARQVCACRDVGELKFAGLEGTVVIGNYQLFFHCCIIKLNSFKYTDVMHPRWEVKVIVSSV